ncbi:alpha/beta hydrolase [Campylobacter sp.]|uniref:alpha/beta hydrolase n=1 Tax=Campylobacter sp. TaxID=205 RepID=UPI0036185D35
MKEEFEIARKRVAIYRIGARNLTLKTDDGSPQNVAGAPIVFYNAFANEADEIARALSELGSVNLTLAAVGGLEWNSEMTPWPMPALFKKEPPLEGGADEYLQTLTQQIVPAVLKRTGGAAWLGIAGYSLGGLFALYSLYKTPLFTRVASVSGSLWYKDFREFALGSHLAGKPERAYFSIGDRESMSKNEYLKTALDATRDIAAHFDRLGVGSKFELNPGNHYADEIGRTVKALTWLVGGEI